MSQISYEYCMKPGLQMIRMASGIQYIRRLVMYLEMAP